MWRASDGDAREQEMSFWGVSDPLFSEGICVCLMHDKWNASAWKCSEFLAQFSNVQRATLVSDRSLVSSHKRQMPARFYDRQFCGRSREMRAKKKSIFSACIWNGGPLVNYWTKVSRSCHSAIAIFFLLARGFAKNAKPNGEQRRIMQCTKALSEIAACSQ